MAQVTAGLYLDPTQTTGTGSTGTTNDARPLIKAADVRNVDLSVAQANAMASHWFASIPREDVQTETGDCSVQEHTTCIIHGQGKLGLSSPAPRLLIDGMLL
jgi:hypothetical protein